MVDMELFGRYLIFQTKRVAKAFLWLIGIVIATTLAVAVLFVGVSNILKTWDIPFVKVGLVIPEEETASRYVVSMLEAMDSVKALCDFEYMSFEEAAASLDSGKLNAVVELPMNFYHDVQVGYNPPAVIYMKETESLPGRMFKEFLQNAVAYLGMAEAGVYSVLDITEGLETMIPREQIGNTVALLYTDRIFNRDRLFVEEYVTAYGTVSSDYYMMAAGMVITLVFFGIGFRVMYGRENQTVLEQLKIKGLSFAGCEITKVLIMTAYIFVLGNFELVALGRISVTGALSILWISWLMAVYFELVYALSKDGRKGVWVLVLINIFGILCSGLIIPIDFLPGYAGAVGRFLPFRYWLEVLLEVMGKGGV